MRRHPAGRSLLPGSDLPTFRNFLPMPASADIVGDTCPPPRIVSIDKSQTFL